MINDAIRAAIQAKGWTCRPKQRRGKEYIYAVRRNGKKIIEKYLGAADRPDIMHLVELLPNSAIDVAQHDDQAESIEPISSTNDLQVAEPSLLLLWQRAVDQLSREADDLQIELSRLRLELLDVGQLLHYDSFVLGSTIPDRAICIRPGRQSWASYSESIDAARLQEVIFYVRRYYNQLKNVGMDEPEPPAPAIDTSDDPTSWTTYTRADRHHYDAKRRAWLKEWAKARNYPATWFTIHGQRSGYYQTKILPGEATWTRFLDGTYYDNYCLFIGLCTPGVPLEHYLNDAAARGEIKLGDELLWIPHDQRKTR